MRVPRIPCGGSSRTGKRFAELTAGRIVDFWFPVPTGSVYTSYAIWANYSACRLPGMILAMVRRRQDGRPADSFTVWLIYPLLYYVVLSCDRYRYPILWTSLLPAGYALEALFISGFRRVWRPAHRPPCSGT
jgi:hypothetical protein